LLPLYQEHVERLQPTPRTAKYYEDPTLLLGSSALVLKSPAGGEKGVLLLLYSYTFPLFAQQFDLERVASRYYLVLEPGCTGDGDVDILSYSRFRFPVFVRAYEPRDAEFLAGLSSNLVPAPTSTHWWVDHRLFRPLPGARKDVDVMMLA